MPLDTGAFLEQPAAGAEPLAKRPRLALDPDVDIGAALRAAREGLGLSLDEIAEITKVRARHLAALELAQLDQLPSRPFTVGYVRAYAKALGLDADAVAARFRTEHPSPDDELRSPVGVRHNRSSRTTALIGVGALAVLAVVGWNIALHATAAPHRRAPTSAHMAPSARANPPGVDGPFAVNTPLPAPPEATAPAPYITPVVGANAPANAINPQSTTPAVAAPPTPFVASGAIYGPTTGASNLIIQAKKSISLEVRGAGGVVYFARQLAAGEAYRVPALPGLTVEVSNPASAELFEGGVSKGVFTQPQMALKTIG